MMKLSLNLILPVALASLGAPAAAATFGVDSIAYSLGNGGMSLVKLAGPGVSTPSSRALNFATAGVSLESITYRPETREFYGYDNGEGTVYLIDQTTGNTSAVASQAGLTSTDDLDFDFNNVLDAARIVTAQDENRVFFPNNMPPDFVSVTDLAYAAGDDNEGRDPNVVANAYTNAVRMPETTLQFALDSDTDVLTTLANNAGTLATVGELFADGDAFDMSVAAGLDILSFSEGDNTAYALLTDPANIQSIFEIPLFADSMGRINMTRIATLDGTYGTLDGLAVAPVPIPASLPLLAAGLGLFGVMRRRKS